MPNAALIVGELCIDVSAKISVPGEALAALADNASIVTEGVIGLVPGGTAWLFASALASRTPLVPLIAAAVGADLAGDMLAATLAERDFPTAGLLRVDGARTDVVSIANFPGKGRLLARPAAKIMHQVQAWNWDLVAEMVATHDVRFAWVSGYVFEHQDAMMLESTRMLFTQLRDRSIPIVLDLVPHEFAKKVGSLGQLETDVGPIDVLVGEYRTLLDLGFGEPERGDVRPAVLDCARSTSQGRLGAVVQHQVSDSHYTLATAGRSPGWHVTDRKIPASGPHGLGDLLAVLGLQFLGLA